MAKKKYTGEYRDYRVKNEILAEECYEVTPIEFYNDIFPDADLEREKDTRRTVSLI